MFVEQHNDNFIACLITADECRKYDLSEQIIMTDPKAFSSSLNPLIEDLLSACEFDAPLILDTAVKFGKKGDIIVLITSDKYIQIEPNLLEDKEGMNLVPQNAVGMLFSGPLSKSEMQETGDALHGHTLVFKSIHDVYAFINICPKPNDTIDSALFKSKKGYMLQIENNNNTNDNPLYRAMIRIAADCNTTITETGSNREIPYTEWLIREHAIEKLKTP